MAEQGGIQGRQIATPLFDTKTGETDRSGYVSLGGNLYRYRFWPGRESEAEIEIEMQEHVPTGELRGPWRLS